MNGSVRFVAELAPGDALIDALAATDPVNPFRTRAYAAAHRALGSGVALLGMRDESGALEGGCLAVLRPGRFGCSAEIASVPRVGEPFWDALWKRCRAWRAWHLELGSHASDAGVRIPSTAGELTRIARQEFLLDLVGGDVFESASSNHRRNIARARRAGLRVLRTSDPEAAALHVALVDASFDRRRDRGESVPAQADARIPRAFLASGAAELFQALDGGQVISSLLVLRARSGGYYQSAGTLPAGRDSGASPFLVAETARLLREDGVTVFNLGGAANDDGGGLVRFKAGFGGRAVALEETVVSLVPPVVRRLRSAWQLLHDDPAALARRIARVERMVVFSAAPGAIAGEPLPAGCRFVPLVPDDVRALGGDDAQRLDELGSGAFGLYADGALAHVAWLIDAERDVRRARRDVALAPGEVEITHCRTDEPFRGRGLYPLAIRQLCAEARRLGARRVFMITNARNRASQRGIVKAGLVRDGSIVRVVLPFVSERAAFTWRAHRWKRRA